VTVIANALTKVAPVITMATAIEAKANESIVLIATVHDPENDNVNVEWHSENSNIVFSDKNNLTTSVALPDVVSTLTTQIILTATDSQLNTTQKSLVLTINPQDAEPSPTVYIELVERIDAISGNVITFNARLISTTEIKAVDWNLTSLNSSNISIENSNEGNVTTSTVTVTAPTVATLTEFPISLTVTTLDDSTFTDNSKIFIAVDNTQSLSVSLPASSEVIENATLSITPTIENSQAIDSYQWRWISDHPLTLLTPTNKVLDLLAPEVDVDIQGQLELTVNMAGLSKIATMDLLIKNSEEGSTVNVTASKLVVVKGQRVTLNVLTDNFEQIKSWSWDTSGLQGVNITKNKSSFEVTAPEVFGQQHMGVTYRATLSDNSEVLKVANITVLSQREGRSSFEFEMPETSPVIINNIENTVTLTFTDRLGLVDSISLDIESSFNSFTKAEMTRTGDIINLVLLATDITFSHTDFIWLNINYGDYTYPLPIKLDMRSN
jgi:hypothetical protein